MSIEIYHKLAFVCIQFVMILIPSSYDSRFVHAYAYFIVVDILEIAKHAMENTMTFQQLQYFCLVELDVFLLLMNLGIVFTGIGKMK